MRTFVLEWCPHCCSHYLCVRFILVYPCSIFWCCMLLVASCIYKMTAPVSKALHCDDLFSNTLHIKHFNVPLLPYQMPYAIEWMVRQRPSKDCLSTENYPCWNFQSLHQTQVMFKISWQCKGGQSKGDSDCKNQWKEQHLFDSSAAWSCLMSK